MTMPKLSLVAFLLLPTALHGTASAEVATVVIDPCMDGETEGDGTIPSCLDMHETCTFDPESCCEGLMCSGFGFYKKCSEPPVCIDEWHDCSTGMPCCDGLACTVGDGGQYECQKPEIGKRTIEIPPGGLSNATQPTPAPTSAPTGPKNHITTKIPGEPVIRNSAESSGDPHITTLDGLTYDCQGEGEFILVKSLITQRQIQARYEQLLPNKPVSWTTGIVVQDEGNTPKVQVSFAKLSSSLANTLRSGCKLQFFVNGVLRNIETGSGHDGVEVRLNRSIVTIYYPDSELQIDLVLSSSCRLNAVVHLPQGSDQTVGLLGTANNNTADEWTTLNGTVIPYDRAQAMKKAGYDFCTKNFCIREEEQSLFTYQEEGIEFVDYQRCDLPYGNTFEQYLLKTPKWILDLCGSDMACIIDVTEGGEEEARQLRMTSLLNNKMCNPSGGVCEHTKCCGTSKCVDYGGMIGKVCDGDLSCSPEFGNCENTPCCEGLSCTGLNDGKHMCTEELVCQKEYMSCDDNDDCCDGLTCINNNKGGKNCRRLPSCMRVWDDCSVIGCCGSLTCVTLASGGKQCQNLPTCWDARGRDCSLVPCCDGLTCITNKDNRQVCAKLPACMKLGQSCEWVPCCPPDDDNSASDPSTRTGPMHCANVIDAQGRHGQQCRYVPGEVHVRVWSDLNANGIYEDHEFGIEGVKLRLYDERAKTFLANHDEMTSDAQGWVRFTEVPKVMPLRVVVTEAPQGHAVPTLRNVVTDASSSSSLPSMLRNDASTDFFRLPSYEDRVTTGIGYLLPMDIEIRAFNDLNNNGIQDEDDMALKGVRLRLQTHLAGEGWVTLPDSPERSTDARGLATFTGVPQRQRLRVQVVDAPQGSIATTKRQGEDRTRDSDLRDDGTTDEFTLMGTEDPHIGLGYRMPRSVIIRIWNDANSNGIQDEGENGIEGVKVRLVYGSKDRPDVTSLQNGGNAHEVLTSDESGRVAFINVPPGRDLLVKVIEPPKGGAFPTVQGAGNDDLLDSDLGWEGTFTRTFTVADSETALRSISLGYRMPFTLTVRVWDDRNGNGLLEPESEPGIAGVRLRVVGTDGRTPVVITGSEGTVNDEVVTNEEGFAFFTGVPQSRRLRVAALNAPPGATPTLVRAGTDRTMDSSLEISGASSNFEMNEAGQLKFNLGYRLPTSMKVRVWDDANYNGIQDADEKGISDVRLCLVLDRWSHDRLPVPADLNDGSNAHEEILTDSDGYATFVGVPKGIRLRVKVLNRPAGAIRTHSNVGNDEMLDSNLNDDGTSDGFDLSTFAGSTFTARNIGFLMPTDMEVRVWDDVNGNGIQDSDEHGISDVILQLVNDDRHRTRIADAENGGNAHEQLVTDQTGVVRFTQVPKGRTYRVSVVNQPVGAIRTTSDQGTDQNMNSNLDSHTVSSPFNLCSFAGDAFRGIGLGYRMPSDMTIFVWDDLNGNGLIDDDEPGVHSATMHLIYSHNSARVEHLGGDSTAHQSLTSGRDGLVTFKGVPKGVDLRVVVSNAPRGSVPTGQSMGDESDRSRDNDLGSNLRTIPFNLDSFVGPGAFGEIALGLQMPKHMVVRVWNDKNKNGIQDDDEEGIPGVRLRLVRNHRNARQRQNLNNIGLGSTAHTIQTTDANGRVEFRRVHRGRDIRVRIVVRPFGNKPISPRGRGDDPRLDSDAENADFSVAFRLPSDVAAFYDMIDFGFVL